MFSYERPLKHLAILAVYGRLTHAIATPYIIAYYTSVRYRSVSMSCAELGCLQCEVCFFNSEVVVSRNSATQY
jgi:hypothetical protein